METEGPPLHYLSPVGLDEDHVEAGLPGASPPYQVLGRYASSSH